jgi:methylglyoxal synthase
MKRLALIAHDNKKVDLVAWATFNREMLARFSLTATRHTARVLERKIGLPVEELLSGPEGGDTQIAAQVAMREVDAVFFFVDPLSAQPHEPDIRALLRVCNVHNVPLATNLSTADLIITAFARLEELDTAIIIPSRAHA